MTAPSLLFVATRWTMVAIALLEFAPIIKTAFDPMPLSHVSYINIFYSNCKTLPWLISALYYAVFIETACKQVYYTTISLFVLLTVHSVFLHKRICYMAAELFMGLHNIASGNIPCGSKSGKLIWYCCRCLFHLLPLQYNDVLNQYSVLRWPGPTTCIISGSTDKEISENM